MASVKKAMKDAMAKKLGPMVNYLNHECKGMSFIHNIARFSFD